jgi:hypothetical protein
LTEGATEAVVTTIILESELDNVPNPTLIRVRGQIANQMAAAGAVNEAFILAHAIMVVDAKQLAIGVTAMPLPLSSNSEDFLWFGQAMIASPVAANSNDVDNYLPTYHSIEVDSKAMRKITLNQAVVLVSELVQVNGTAGAVQFWLNLRMLLKK